MKNFSTILILALTLSLFMYSSCSKDDDCLIETGTGTLMMFPQKLGQKKFPNFVKN